MKKVLITCLTVLILVVYCIPAYACTVFNTMSGSTTLVGNNEDSQNRNSRAWFLPAEGNKHGAVFFGYEDSWAQGGMNDQGLFLDWASTEVMKPGFSLQNISFKDLLSYYFFSNLNEKILRECSNLNEALDIFKKSNEPSFYYAHVMVVDKSGASAIVEMFDGELKTLPKEENYQYMTNFNISASKQAGYNCTRYSMLEHMFSINPDATVDNIKSMLSATKLESTIYSNIYDLNTGDIYLYYLGNFDNPVKLNLGDELKKGRHIYNLSELFNRPVSPSTTASNSINLFGVGTGKTILSIAVLCLIALVIALLLVFSIRRYRRRKAPVDSSLSDKLSLTGIIITVINSILTIAFLKGLMDYGFYLRYGFTIYESILYIMPYIIACLTFLQIIPLILAWKKNLLFLVEKGIGVLDTSILIGLVYMWLGFILTVSPYYTQI